MMIVTTVMNFHLQAADFHTKRAFVFNFKVNLFESVDRNQKAYIE